MILGSLVLLALLGLGMVLAEGRQWVATAVSVAAVALLALACGQLEVRTDATKTLKDTDTVAAGDWGAVFRVDAVDLGDLKVLHHDGLWGSSIWRYDGTPATTSRFDTDIRQVPFAALANDAPSVLIIGAAGGNEIMASLTYGAGHVDAVADGVSTHTAPSNIVATDPRDPTRSTTSSGSSRPTATRLPTPPLPARSCCRRATCTPAR